MEPYLQQLAFEAMLHDLKEMTPDAISAQLKRMGCDFDYATLKQMLSHTYNDLGVADEVFSRFSIQEQGYPKAFVDEAVLEIAKREKFGFTHYGILSEQIRVIMGADIEIKTKLSQLESEYRKLCQCAQYFDVKALETMQYLVNDGIDVYALLMETLDLMLQEAVQDRSLYQQLIRFTEKLLAVFSNSNAFLKAGILYEQATAYVSLKSTKGDQIFTRLLKTHEDPCDVLLHYALAYLDHDEKKAMRILQSNQHYWDEKSDAYEVIQLMIKESTCHGGGS